MCKTVSCAIKHPLLIVEVLCCVLWFQLHIVHIKEPYGSLVEAEHDMVGIALLAFLFEVMHSHSLLSMTPPSSFKCPN